MSRSDWPRCAVCRDPLTPRRPLVHDDATDLRLCNECFERLDMLDRNHPYPAFMFAAAVVRNRWAADREGVR